jgi:malate synthase
MYFFHNAKYRAEQGSGIYLYLPKMEHYLEARLWNDIFVKAQALLGLPQGTVKATVLIEHILAAFQMEEILYELRHHSAGLNCGRWDYIFSFIKKFAKREDYLMPDRALVGMTTPFMRAYSLACIKTCHKRGTFAMGGMAAQIPIKNDPEANERAMTKVRADKKREAEDGHDGTWVAHPALVAIALEEFDKVLGSKPNQIDKQRDDVTLSQADLLAVPSGAITEHGIRENIKVGVQYLEAWLSGVGCVPLYNLMEDAATAEISRTQLWQWVHNRKAVLDDSRPVTLDLVRTIAKEEMDAIKAEVGADRFARGKYREAAQLFDEFTANEELAEFLTLAAYEQLD